MIAPSDDDLRKMCEEFIHSPPPPDTTLGQISDGVAIARALLQRVAQPAASEADKWRALAGEMAEALAVISHGSGKFSRDPLEHAANCIEEMKAIAEAALAKYIEAVKL